MALVLTGVGLVAACDDSELLGFPLWPKQRELLQAVEDGPRLQVWALGRRSGKTTVAAIVGLHDCLFRPDLDALVRPRELRHAVAIATAHRQARLFVRAALSIIERSPLAGLIDSVSEDEITFDLSPLGRNARTALSAFPCTSRGARGWPISVLLMDEAAHFLSDTEGPQVADRVFEALAPSTAQFGEAARIIVASTPYGTGNLFHSLFERASAGELPGAIAQHATSARMNPTLSEGWLETQRALDPTGFAQEYQADFLAGGANYFEADRLELAVAKREELGRLDAVNWIAGLDPAFSHDPFGLAIVGTRPADGKLVLGLTRRWRPSTRRVVSFEERAKVRDDVLAEVVDVCRTYGARAVVDQHLAPAIMDRLRRGGVSVRTVAMTAQSKTDAFAELRARIYGGDLELYREPQLLAELGRLRTRYVSGRASVVNPHTGDSHGDQAQALALAVWEHKWHRTGPREEQPPSRRESRYERGILTEFRYGQSL